MNRLERMQAILTRLQSKKIVTAHELSERFEVSLRTIYRDIRSLEESGIPIGAEAGLGYYITDGYYLPPVMFTKQEAEALVLGGKLIAGLTDKDVDNQFNSALGKVKAVLDGDKKEDMEFLERRIVINPFGEVVNGEIAPLLLGKIQSMLPDRKPLKLTYHASYSGQTTERIIEPVGIVYYSAAWHLIGFCLLRNDYRDFRIDRIEKIELTDGKLRNPEKLDLNKYLAHLRDSTELHIVKVKVNAFTARQIREIKYQMGFVDETADGEDVIMTFAIPNVEFIGRWFLMSTSGVTVLEPESLKIRMKELVKELGDHYR